MRKPTVYFAILALVLMALALLTSQRGGLAYFSPDSLQYHIQSERTFFAVGVPFYRSSLKQIDNPLITFLVNEKFISPQLDTTGRREHIFHWNDSWRGGDGALYGVFHRYRKEIIDWSINNRECAQIYWSEGFRCLRSTDRREINLGQSILTQLWRIDDPELMREAIKQLRSDTQ